MAFVGQIHPTFAGRLPTVQGENTSTQQVDIHTQGKNVGMLLRKDSLSDQHTSVYMTWKEAKQLGRALLKAGELARNERRPR